MTGAVFMGMFYLQVLYLSVDLHVSHYVSIATPIPFCCAGPLSSMFKLITPKKEILQEENFYCLNLIFWAVFLLLPYETSFDKDKFGQRATEPP